MDIEKWKALAESVIPQLEGYAKKFGIFFNSQEAMDLLHREEYEVVWTLFENLWEDLPDSPDIRVGVFFPLCDLCTEFPMNE